MSKPKVAFYWCSSCGGCEEAVVDLNEGVLQVTEAVDIVFWPVALDFKYSDVKAMADGEITVSFINGAIRLDDQAEIVRLLRQKSQVVIAFGSCAHMGGIPGLANLTTKGEIFDRAYLSAPTMENPDGVVPLEKSIDEGRELNLPGFWETVRRLDEVIDVDYFLPGCPPMPNTIMDAVGAILEGKLPPKGAVLSPTKNICHECSRRARKPETISIDRLRRPHEVAVPQDECFLAHGVVCMGPATRSGCGERCMLGGSPCRGCYGPSDGVEDQGAAFIAAFSSMVDTTDDAELDRIFSTFDDMVGTLYRFSLPASLSHRGGLLSKKGGQPK